MLRLVQSTARNAMLLLVANTDHVTGLTSATLTITASKDGAAFASITPTVTERGNGWYSLALTTGHTDTLGELVLHVTAAGADPIDVAYDVVANPATATAVAAVAAQLPAALVGGRMDASVGAMAANVLTAAAINAAAITAAKFATDAVDANALAASAVTEIQSGLATAAGVASVQADTDDLQARLPAALIGGKIDATLSAGERTSIATAVLDLAAAIDGATPRETLSRMAAALVGKVSGMAAGSPVFRKQDDSGAKVTATCDASGNRTAVAFS